MLKSQYYRNGQFYPTSFRNQDKESARRFTSKRRASCLLRKIPAAPTSARHAEGKNLKPSMQPLYRLAAAQYPFNLMGNERRNQLSDKLQ